MEPISTLIPIAQAISKAAFKGEMVPVHNIKIHGVLTSPTRTEYLCSVGSANIIVAHAHHHINKWSVRILETEPDYSKARMKFLGAGAHEE